MQSNPFAPPNAFVEDDASVRPAKPMSIWLLQIFAILVGALFVVGLTVGVVSALTSGHATSGRLAFGVAVRLGMLVGIFYAVKGAQRGVGYGRWLGLLFIAILFAMMGYVGWNMLEEPAPSGMDAAGATGYKAGQAVAIVAILLLVAFWFRSFGFSPRARSYFRPRAVATAEAARDLRY